MTTNYYNRRGDERRRRELPALLHKDMVQTINLSSTGARLVVKNPAIKPRMPLMIEIGDNEYVGLMCEPRWRRQIGQHLYVVGVRFPTGQEDLRKLQMSLSQAG